MTTQAEERFLPLVCEFCAVQSGDDLGMTSGYIRACPSTGRRSRVMYESESGWAVVALGPIREGNTVLFARRHAAGTRDLAVDEFGAMSVDLKRLLQWLKPVYGPYAVFEHGNVAGSPATMGGCVEHAHFQLMPSNSEELPALLAPSTKLTEVDSIGAIRQVEPGLEYLYFQDTTDRHWLATATSFDGQVFRRGFARLEGRPGEWNWRTHPGCARLARTLDSVRRLNKGDPIDT